MALVFRFTDFLVLASCFLFLAFCVWLLTSGFWLLAFASRLLVSGLALGLWLLVFGFHLSEADQFGSEIVQRGIFTTHWR